MQRRKLSSENRSRHCSLQTSFTYLDAFLRRYFVTNLLVCLDLPKNNSLSNMRCYIKLKEGTVHSWEDDRMFAVFAPVLYHHRWIDKEEKKSVMRILIVMLVCLSQCLFIHFPSLPCGPSSFLNYTELFLKYFANPLLRYSPTNFPKCLTMIFSPEVTGTRSPFCVVAQNPFAGSRLFISGRRQYSYVVCAG